MTRYLRYASKHFNAQLFYHIFYALSSGFIYKEVRFLKTHLFGLVFRIFKSLFKERGEIKLCDNYRNEHNGTADIFLDLHFFAEENSAADRSEYRLEREDNRRDSRVGIPLSYNLKHAGKAGNTFHTKQGNRLSCRDQEGRWGSDEVGPGL